VYLVYFIIYSNRKIILDVLNVLEKTNRITFRVILFENLMFKLLTRHFSVTHKLIFYMQSVKIMITISVAYIELFVVL